MKRGIKIFGALILAFSFYSLICGCSNKSMFASQAKAAIKSFEENEIFFPDINENILSDIIETAYVSTYDKKYDSYEYVLSFESADEYNIDYSDFTGGGNETGSKTYAGELKSFIKNSMTKPENIKTRKNYSIKCTFEKTGGGWICEIDGDDAANIKSAFDLYGENLFQDKLNSSEEYKALVKKELEPQINEFVTSQIIFPVNYDIDFSSLGNDAAVLDLHILKPDFDGYRMENPDALFPPFNFRGLTSNPLNEYNKILHKNLEELAEKDRSNSVPYDIAILFSRKPDGGWEYNKNDSAVQNSVTEINDIINTQVGELIGEAQNRSDIIHILSRYYNGVLYQCYPEYLNCEELSEFISVEDIKISGTGKYEITLNHPSLDELAEVAKTNFLNSITHKYYDINEINFNKKTISDYYNKADIEKIKTKEKLSYTYDRNDDTISSGTVNEKFDAAVKNATEAAAEKWLVKERPQPNSGIIYNNSGGGNSFINFYKYPGANMCFYKLYNSSDKLVVTMFLNTDSDSVGLYLPSGSYYLKYSYGTKWYGPDDAFGSSGHYGKSESFVVMYDCTYEYTFVYSGGKEDSNENIDLNAIDMSGF